MGEIDPDAVEQIPSEAASTYTKLAAATGGPYYESVADELAPQLAGGDRLLDAGAGPGFLTLLLADRVDDLRIDAFDFTHALVAHGRAAARRRGLTDRVSFFTADCYAIPVVDETYSTLLSTGVLHSLDDPDAALAECHRVLEPGGTAWVFDPTILQSPADVDLDLTRHEREIYEAYGVQTADDPRPITVTEAQRLAADSPFQETTVEEGAPGDVRLTLTRGE